MDQIMDFESLFFRYKDGRAARLMGTEILPPSIDSNTGVASKDVLIVPDTGVSARLYLPKNTTTETHHHHNHKLPLLIYFHGGGFCVESPFSPAYHTYLNSFVAQTNVVAVSVHYRLAPEHPLPTAYEDAFAAIKWATSTDSDDWLTENADSKRVFLAGDSAGANICHQMAIRSEESGVRFEGVALVNPYFCCEDRFGSDRGGDNCEFLEGDLRKLWFVVCPGITGLDEPFINPVASGAPRLDGLGCEKVLVCVSENDPLRERGWVYYEKLRESGWRGVVEIVETLGEGHVFHLFQPESEKAGALMKRLVDFINQN